MDKKYCGATRFDYLDPEERTMIYKAMETYAKAKVAEYKNRFDPTT